MLLVVLQFMPLAVGAAVSLLNKESKGKKKANSSVDNLKGEADEHVEHVDSIEESDLES